MTALVNRARIQRYGANNYALVSIGLSDIEDVEGCYIEATVGSTLAATTTVSLYGSIRELDVAAEDAGNTHYSINGAAAANRKIGDFTFDFRVLKTNRLFLRPGTVVGGVTLPAVLPANLTFVFKTDSIPLTEFLVSRRDQC